jgi:hypothetical protein
MPKNINSIYVEEEQEHGAAPDQQPIKTKEEIEAEYKS